MVQIRLLFIVLMISLAMFSCSKNRKFGSFENQPVNAQERARKNVEEGRGAGLGSLLGNRGTNFEFSSSNPMWRASLDFLPLSTVDYSGGVIVSDWYSDNTKSNESIKISVRFLSNEIRSDSLKIIVHKKNCSSQLNCKTILQKNSQIVSELRRSILTKASLLEKEQKENKKK